MTDPAVASVETRCVVTDASHLLAQLRAKSGVRHRCSRGQRRLRRSGETAHVLDAIERDPQPLRASPDISLTTQKPPKRYQVLASPFLTSVILDGSDAAILEAR